MDASLTLGGFNWTDTDNISAYLILYVIVQGCTWMQSILVMIDHNAESQYHWLCVLWHKFNNINKSMWRVFHLGGICQHRDLNSRSLNHVSPPMTTRPWAACCWRCFQVDLVQSSSCSAHLTLIGHQGSQLSRKRPVGSGIHFLSIRQNKTGGPGKVSMASLGNVETNAVLTMSTKILGRPQIVH